MKLRHALLAIFIWLPGAAWTQDLHVRIFAAHPPAEITIAAADGLLRWRICATCPEKAGRVLSVKAGESELKFGADQADRELYISGAYHLHRADGPEFAANFPLHMESRGQLLLITASMPLEEYVQAVLAAEGGEFEQSESLKAMAVAARTYAIRFRGQHQTDGFDFCDTTHCQAVRWNAVNPRIVSAVDATRGELLLFRGALAQTFYNQNCGGTAASAGEVWPAIGEPYLVTHPDTYCSVTSQLKWESSITVADLDRALRQAGLVLPRGWKTIEIMSRTASGRAERLNLEGGAPSSAVVSASSFRFAVDRALGWEKIRSDLYQVRNSDAQVLFSGRGSGHGVGLCQAGAEEMAREGKNYAEILSYYYPGTRLERGQAEEWQKRAGERIELISISPAADASVLPIVEHILQENENSIGWRIPFRVRLQVYPTLDQYRDGTGKPGWVAASTRGHTIRLQPLLELQRRSILESTLRHELFHLLMESHSRAGTPLWFQEGLALYFSDSSGSGPPAPAMTTEQIEAALRQSSSREEMQQAYAAARGRVAGFVNLYGKAAVLSWLSGGLPPMLTVGSRSLGPNAPQQ